MTRLIDRDDPNEISLDEVVKLLAAAGVKSYVEQTGGGCATIYVGEPLPHRDGEDWGRQPVLVGPGWFAGPGWTIARAHTSDLSVGPDDDGVSDEYTSMPLGSTATQVAAEVLRQMEARS